MHLRDFIFVRQRGQLVVFDTDPPRDVRFYAEGIGILIGVFAPHREADQRGIVFLVKCRSEVCGPKGRLQKDWFGEGE